MLDHTHPSRSSVSRRLLVACLIVLATIPLVAIGLSRGTTHADDVKPEGVDSIDTQATDGPVTTPEQALAKMKAPEGFKVQLFAAEPQVRQPICFATDERGRIWVAENNTYAESKVNFDLRYHDQIVILEDTDGDGKADSRKVFWDKCQHLTAVNVGFGGVWALCAPQLLFIPDRNHDDVPDGEPIVVLDGWNDGAVRHNIVNGLTWGPDGWLYGRHGILATSFVGKPGTPPSQRTQINCGVWRYHPTREVFEAVAHGTTNPWGFDYDDYGQMFFINTVIGHLWHIVPGAHYRRMYGVGFDSHTYQLLEQCADHFHWDTREQWSDIRKGMSDSTSSFGGGHAHCGLMIYLGGSWPDEYRNNVFTVNLHGLRLNRDRLERSRSGYVAKHGKDFLFANDQWFRGLELIYGPDGGVYIADWSDIGECHDNDGIHRSTGRIYKVTYGDRPPAPTVDVSKLNDLELVALQLDKNDWYVRTARRVLQERAAEGKDLTAAHRELQRMFDGHADVTRRLRALWCLAVSGGANSEWLIDLLKDQDEHVRTWAVKLLADGPEVTKQVATKLGTLDDKSALVRLFIASAMQRMPLENRWNVAKQLVKHAEDNDDPMLPLMIWYGIEPAVPANPAEAVALAKSSKVSLVRRFVSRRITEDIENNPKALDSLVAAATSVPDQAVKSDILSGMQEALKGWRKAPQPASWEKLAKSIQGGKDEDLIAHVRDLSVVFGDGRALDELKKIALTGDAPVESRRNALRMLVENRTDELFPMLQKLLNDRAMTNDVIRSFAACEQPEVASIVLGQYGRLDGAGREDAVNTLVARPNSAKALLAALQSGAVDRRDVTAFHARQIRSFGDEGLNAMLSKAWGDIRESQKDKQELVAKLKGSLTADKVGAADRSNGRLLFAKNCSTCHKLFGTGNTIGPDLTGSNRQNLDYLLENVVDPSATMAADYKVSTVTLHDGRIVTGIVLEKSKHTMTVQTQKERIVINSEDVEKAVLQNVSLMPEGLLSPLSETQIVDLVAYVSGKTQVSLPEGEITNATSAK